MEPPDTQEAPEPALTSFLWFIVLVLVVVLIILRLVT